MVLTLKRKMSLKYVNIDSTQRTLQQDKENKSRIEIHNHLLMATFFMAVQHLSSTVFNRAVHSNLHLLTPVYL